jgi:hypothetical protein
LEYLQTEETRVTKLDYYLAQLTAETRRSWVKSPNKVKTNDFLLRPKEETEKMKKSKSVWLGALNIKSSNN